MRVRFLGKEDLLECAEPSLLFNSLRRGLEEVSKGKVQLPGRTVLTAGDSWWGVMPAYQPSQAFVTKVVSVIPGNTQRGLPPVQGALTLYDAQTGRLSGVMDGAPFTAIRTAVTTLFAVTELTDAKSFYFRGCGYQANYHAEMLAKLMPGARINADSRSIDSKNRFLENAAKAGLKIDHSLTADTANALIIATSSTTPVLEDRPIGPKIVASIGAHTPEERELSDLAISRFGLVVVDSIENCTREAGDIVQTLASGILKREKLVELKEALNAGRGGSGGGILYKSVGAAYEDLFVASALAETAQKKNLGVIVEA